MYDKVRAIVISSLKYSDNSLIVKSFTQTMGTRSYLLQGVLAQKNGNLYFKLTPKRAGSVIPRRADTPAEDARPLVFSLFVKNKMAKVAAPCATLAIDATTKMKSP